MPWPPQLRGREFVVTSALRALADPSTRVVTLTGLPGVGTTTVARELVARLREQVDAVPFVDARRATTPGALTRMVSEAVVVADLVVIDDADHPPTAATELRQVLERRPDARLLLTAGSPLHLPGESVVRVLPLPSPDPDLDLDLYAVQPAIRVFLDAAVRSGTTADLDGEALRDIAAICAALGGIPKAIELAAARTPTLSPATLLSRLNRSSPSLVITNRGGEGAGGHGSEAEGGGVRDDHDLFRAIRWSASLLKEESRGLLAELAVFHSAVSLDAIEAVTGRTADIDALSELVEAHLVDPVHGTQESRYVVPPLVREHADQLLGSHAERAAELRTRHTQWAVSVAVEARRLEESGRPTAALTHVAALEADLVAALVRVTAPCDGRCSARLATQLVLGLAPLWFNRAPTPTEMRWVERVTPCTVCGDAAPTTAEHAMLLAWRGALGVEQARDKDHVATALADLATAVELADRVGQTDRGVQVRVLMLIVRASRSVKDSSAIEPLCRRGHEAALREDDRVALITFESWASVLAHRRGDLEEAGRCARMAYERARRMDDPQSLLVPAGLLRTLPPGMRLEAERGGDVTEGVPTFEQLLDIARRCGDLLTLSWMLPAATIVAIHRGDLASAATFSVEALRRTRASGSPMRSLLPLMGVIVLAFARGDTVVARQLREAVRPFQQVLVPTVPPWVVEAYGEQIFGVPMAGGSVGAAGLDGAGALGDVQVAASRALDYVRSIGLAPVIRLAPSLVDSGAGRSRPEKLTEREWEVLTSMTSGATNKELSELLGISAKTVMHHTSSIYRKLGVRSRSEAVAWAMRHHHGERGGMSRPPAPQGAVGGL